MRSGIVSDLLSPPVMLALIAGVLLGLLTYCWLKSGRSSGPGPSPEDDPAVEEARRVRAEAARRG